MRDAARAAAQSDPDENRWFRRRWVETGLPLHASANGPAPVDTLSPKAEALAARDTDDGDLVLLGQELLAAWRRERAMRGGRQDV